MHSRLYARLRQLTFPAPFRIAAADEDDWADSLAALAAEALAAARTGADVNGAPEKTNINGPAEKSNVNGPADAFVRAAVGGDGDHARAAPDGHDHAPLAEAHAPDAAFALALCNNYFRLHRNAEQLALEGQNSKELRGIARALENMGELLRRHGIECRDLTGQVYDAGRLDFEPIGEPEAVPGLDGTRIGRCERPAVFVNDKLIQTARGLVTKPA